MYLDYETYVSMGGKAEETAFTRLSFLAQQKVDRYTQKRVQRMAAVPEAVQRCTVDLIDAMNSNDPSKVAVSPAVSGFSNDGYSESYATPVTSESLERGYYNIIRSYLAAETDDAGTPLLYLGVDA